MDNKLLNYSGKAVMITGASSGIGRATALAFAGEGAKICIGDISARASESVEMIKNKAAKRFSSRQTLRRLRRSKLWCGLR